MPTIKIEKRKSDGSGGKTGGFFYIEMKEPTPDLILLQAVQRATPKADVVFIRDGRINYNPTIPNVLVLWSSGFDWEPEAITEALSVLAKAVQKATFTEIE